MSGSPERRSCERVAMHGDVHFRRAWEVPFTAELADLSATGCQIAPPVRVSDGERVWVKLPGLEALHSTIRWSCGWTAGAIFEKPLHPAVFDAILARLKRG